MLGKKIHCGGNEKISRRVGVKFNFDEEAREIIIDKSNARKIITSKNEYVTDVVISGADYHFIEINLLTEAYRSIRKNIGIKRY